MCADGVLVDVDLGRLGSRLLTSVAEAAPGEMIPLPGVASRCLDALQSMHALFDAANNTNPIDVIRTAIELDCDASVHTDRVRHRVGDALTPLVDLDQHQGTHDELRRWFDTFAAAPPLYFVYTLDARIRDRLRNLLSHCRSPSAGVVDSAVDFFRRMGRCPLSDPIGTYEMAFLARALAGSEAVRGREVALAKCLIEHVAPHGSGGPNVRNAFWEVRNAFWEELCEACVASSRPADAIAIAAMCTPDMGFADIVRSLLGSTPPLPSTASRAFVEHLYASKDDATRGMIWEVALDSPSRQVVEWAMAFTGNQVTSTVLKRRRCTPMLFDIAMRDDRCADAAQVADLLVAFKTYLSIEILQLERVARVLESNGALASDLILLITKTKSNTIIAGVIEHLAASPGLRRGSDGWFEAIAHLAKRRDLAAVERLVAIHTFRKPT